MATGHGESERLEQPKLGPDDLETRRQIVPNGDGIALTTQDLREICLMAKIGVEEVSDRVLQCFRDQGISIRVVRKT